MMTTEARSNFSFAIRRRRSLISSRYSSMAQVYSRIAATDNLVNQRMGTNHGGDQDGDDIDDFDHGVDRRPGCIFIRIAHGIAGDGGGMRLGSLATEMPILDVLLGVVPGTATRGHLDREEDPCHDRPNQPTAKRLRPHCEATQH